jgi:hypothetical protein
MSEAHSILMADVAIPKNGAAPKATRALGMLVSTVNAMQHDKIRSPFTMINTTVFQGVLDSPQNALDALFLFERLALRYRLPYKLRYVMLIGDVDTELDPDREQTLVGAGVSEALELLTRKARSKPRIQIRVPDEILEAELNDLFRVLDGLTARWKAKDASLLHDLLSMDKVSAIADRHGKNRGQIYKRRHTLLTEEYRIVREFILNIGARLLD